MLYTNVRFPRPAGPFPSQSIQFLERTLVRSERLTRSWTTQPMEDISTIRMPGLLSKPPKMVFGKWLIFCESSIKFVAYDLDSGTVSHSNYQLLWESVSPIFSWDACPVVTTNGLLIYVVFRVATMSVPWFASSLTHGVHAFRIHVFGLIGNSWSSVLTGISFTMPSP